MGEPINPRPLFAAPILLAGMGLGAYLMRDHLGLDKLVARIYPDLDGVNSSFIHVYRPTDESLIILRSANSVSEITGRGVPRPGDVRDAARSSREPSAEFGRRKTVARANPGDGGSAAYGAQGAKPLFKAVETFVPVRKFPSRTSPIYDRRPSPWNTGGKSESGIGRGGPRPGAGSTPFGGSYIRVDWGSGRRSRSGRDHDGSSVPEDAEQAARVGEQGKAMLGRAAAAGVLGPSSPPLENAHQAAVASSQYAARLAGDVAAKAPPEAQQEAQLALQLSNQAVDAAQSGDHRSAAALDDQALKHLQQVAAIQKALREENSSQSVASPSLTQGGRP